MVDEDRQETAKKPRSPLLDENGKFVKGNPGGPGRPKGSRDALEYDFVNALQAEFNKRGAAAVAKLDAKALCDIVTKVLPKESRIDVADTFTDLLARAADVVSKRRG